MQLVSRLRPTCTSHVRTRNKADVPLRPSPRGQSSRRSSLNAARKPAEPFPRICQAARVGEIKAGERAPQRLRLPSSKWAYPKQARGDATRVKRSSRRSGSERAEGWDGRMAYPVTVSPVTRARRPRPTTREGARMGAAWGARPRAVGPWHAMRGGACCCPQYFWNGREARQSRAGVQARRAGPARQSSLL